MCVCVCVCESVYLRVYVPCVSCVPLYLSLLLSISLLPFTHTRCCVLLRMDT